MDNNPKDSFEAMFSKPLEPGTIIALRALAGIEGRSQVELPALGFSAEDLVGLGNKIAAI